MPIYSALFVIDTDLARACSTSTRTPAPECLSFLDTLLEVCHRVVVSDELMEEWNRHTKSNAAFNRWLRRMFGRHKVKRCGTTEDEQLSRLVSARATSEEERDALRKDLHLVATARRYTARIASLDERARKAFSRLSAHDESLAIITWVNPKQDSEVLIDWLRSGAPADHDRFLGGQTARNWPSV